MAEGFPSGPATAEVLVQWLREEKKNVRENLFATAKVLLQLILL